MGNDLKTQYFHLIQEIDTLLYKMSGEVKNLHQKILDDPENILFGDTEPKRIAEIIKWQSHLKAIFDRYYRS